MEKKWIYFGMALAVFVLLWRYYELPDYHIKNSYRLGSDNYVESVVSVTVYKSLFSKQLYEKLENKYLKINGRPNKLIFKLFLPFSKKEYRTVVQYLFNNSTIFKACAIMSS